MDIRDLELFIAVADTLNFRAAADNLNLTQPPLTRAIAKLEHELGVKLFERSTRKVELTPAGMTLLKEAQDIIERIHDLKNSVKEVAKLKRGHLKIGITSAALHSAAIKSIWKFKEEQPYCDVNIIEGPVDAHIRNLRKGKLDIAILQAPAVPEKEMPHLILEQEPLGILVYQGHPLQKRKSIKLQDLEGETLIMHDPKEVEGFHRAVKNLFSESRVKVQFYYRQKNENCGLLAASGKGLLLTTNALAKFALPGITLVPIENNKARMSIAAYWINEDGNIALRSFLNFLRNQDFIKSPKSACLMSLANW
ncbi:LysR family transcriptional regulator [Pseudobdellovibrio exovorus]|uniref:HTH lysR-type domain-containing protein n=1 Tax=Pseudobdellovibrio exovorus JSS TaxID=1184267 RepID=M4V901_9BACT|nr:LysR family transcriptional regulator [Pseudobdellovibrio exovorus]AGH94476.1 hypothetical protein A11Q_256 [Pseudobdellovibrio exovorus JSS]